MKWDDAWIKDQIDTCEIQSELFDKYICAHPDEFRTFSAFKYHIRSLGFKKYHKYTKEQDEWLVSNYPDLGIMETLDRFELIFGVKPSLRSLTGRIAYLGLHISDDRRKRLAECNKSRLWGRATPIGTINTTTKMIKTENGWERLGRVLGVPNGFYAVHLDGDITNNSSENIAIIDRATSMRMTLNDFWSEDPEITKAGILCCELESILNKEA